MLKGMAVLLLLQAAGELLSNGLDLPIPGNVIGMILLFLALRWELVKLETVKEAAELLLANLGLLFVPAGVGVMVYFNLIQKEWLPLLVATVFSTFAVMAVTGWVDQLLAKKEQTHVE